MPYLPFRYAEHLISAAQRAIGVEERNENGPRMDDDAPPEG